MSPIPGPLVDFLVEVGSAARDGPLPPEVQRNLITEAPYSFSHWDDWLAESSRLDVEARVKLVCGFALATVYCQWNAGSPSPLVRLFGSLERDLPFERLNSLARWIEKRMEGRWHYYLPYGAIRGRESFLRRHLPSSHFIEMDRERATRRAAHERRQTDDQNRAALARATHAQERETHAARKRVRDELWRSVLGPLDGGSHRDRLSAVADRDDIPLTWFPVSWATVSDSDMDGLPEGVRDRLLRRLAQARGGPWRRLLR